MIRKSLRESYMSDLQHQRPLEPEIHRNLHGRLSYAEYLQLDRVLSAQLPLSCPPHHDEMLFIIQHQVTELWFKLILYELRAARDRIRADDLDTCEKILARSKAIQRQLFEQWGVLETLTPSEYIQFRDALGPASGLQSLQYCTIEFILGNKQREILGVFAHDEKAQSDLRAELESPSLYDEFLKHLARQGHTVPEACLERDWSQPYQPNDELIPMFLRIYAAPVDNWAAYALCEKLVDIDEHFQLWRFRHMKTVERIIGFKSGTGGSSGATFLRQAVGLSFFPELLQLRTEIG